MKESSPYLRSVEKITNVESGKNIAIVSVHEWFHRDFNVGYMPFTLREGFVVCSWYDYYNKCIFKDLEAKTTLGVFTTIDLAQAFYKKQSLKFIRSTMPKSTKTKRIKSSKDQMCIVCNIVPIDLDNKIDTCNTCINFKITK